MDVVSASLEYLIVNICGTSKFGLLSIFIWGLELIGLGSMGKRLIKGDQEFSSADAALVMAVDEFNATLSRFGHSVGFKVYDLLVGKSFTTPFLIFRRG